MYPIVHMEMPAIDRTRMIKFYEAVFGWKQDMVGPDGDYNVMLTSERAEDGFPKERGRINAGFFDRRGPKIYPCAVIAVDDVEACIKNATEHGATVVTEPTDIPNIGTIAYIMDTEGNRVGLIQPFGM